MDSIERFSTAVLQAPRRLQFWNEITAQAYAGTRVHSDDSKFVAEMWRWRVGNIIMLRPRSPSAVVERGTSGRSGPDTSRRLVLHIQQRGCTRFRQAGREAQLRAGDMEVNFAPRHYRLDLAGPNDLLSVDMPATPVLDRVPNLEERICTRIPAQSGAVQMLHSYLLSLWQSGTRDLCTDTWKDDAVEALYCLVAAAARAEDNPRQEDSLLARLKAVVDAQFDDPRLMTATLAAETGVSPRTVQAAFSSEGTTPSAYITEVRLERAARWLRQGPTRSITAIAMSAGFNDSAYFSRCFRNRFGCSPRDWRQC
jgi:AraC-like DNA-binding protein